MTEVTKGKVTKGIKGPECRWCGRALRPNYQRRCVDCGHAEFWHPMTGSSIKTCRSPQHECKCEQKEPGWAGDTPEKRVEWKGYKDRQFPKVRTGFGKWDGGKFCTFDCALQWANKYAK